MRSRKCYFDGGTVEIAAELVHELDADGKQLRVVKLTDYTAEKVRSLCARPEDLRARWADAGERADIIHQLAERGIDFAAVAAERASRTPTCSTCCAISLSTRPCSPDASARTHEEKAGRQYRWLSGVMAGPSPFLPRKLERCMKHQPHTGPKLNDGINRMDRINTQTATPPLERETTCGIEPGSRIIALNRSP